MGINKEFPIYQALERWLRSMSASDFAAYFTSAIDGYRFERCTRQTDDLDVSEQIRPP